MTTRSAREIEDDRLLAERAAEWLIVLRSAGAKEREEFADWLAESPRHVREFLATTAFDQELHRVRFRGSILFESLLERPNGAVVPIRAAMAAGTPGRAAAKHQWWPSPRARWAAAFAAILIVAAAFGWQLMSRPVSYETGIGEQRAVLLPDGSRMTLTAGTEVTVRFSEDRRAIELTQGEASFEVSQDTRRPFAVLSQGNLIQAIGTQFNVAMRPSGILVSVVEGAVSVSRSDSGRSDSRSIEALTLRAGDEVKLTGSGDIVKREKAEESSMAAWRERRLVFRADTLVDIAAEFNRYNQAPRLIVAGDAEHLPRYTGVFDAADPRSLLAFLREDSQIALEEVGDKIIIRRRSDSR